MGKLNIKIKRYIGLFKTVINWKNYLLFKINGTKKSFTFNIKNFGLIEIERDKLGPFKESFFDNIYFRHIPSAILTKNTQPVIIDLGANVGFFSLAAFSKFPKAKIFSIEPHPYCVRMMKDYQNIFKSFNWKVFQLAVSDQDGEINLNTSTVDGFTTMASVFQNETKEETFIAKSVKLDSFIFDKGLTNIDFIKIDVEGSEYPILYGLPVEVFEKINSLCIETHRSEEKKQNTDFLNNYLVKLGYTTKVLNEDQKTGYIWAWKLA